MGVGWKSAALGPLPTPHPTSHRRSPEALLGGSIQIEGVGRHSGGGGGAGVGDSAIIVPSTADVATTAAPATAAGAGALGRDSGGGAGDSVEILTLHIIAWSGADEGSR